MKILNKIIEGLYDSNKDFSDLYGDDLMKDFKSIDNKNAEDVKEKSPACSYVLQKMDSYEDAQDYYFKFVNEAVAKFGVDKAELEKELELYI